MHLSPLESRDTPTFIVVQNTADSGPNTLRDAINQANASPGFDEIDIDVIGTVQFDSPLPDLTTAMKIEGPGANQLTVRPSSYGSRVFTVRAGADVELDGMTIAEGKADFGGGVYNEGNLHVNGCSFDHNTAQLQGGGLYNKGNAELNDTSFFINVTFGAGGGIASLPGSALSLDQCTVVSNYAEPNAIGGGVYLNGLNATIEQSTIVGNYANFTNPAGAGAQYAGGGLYVSLNNPTTAYLHNTVVADNYRGNYQETRDDIYGKVNINSRANFVSSESAMVGIADANNENQVGHDGGFLDAHLKLHSDTRPYYVSPDVGSPLIDAGDDLNPLPAGSKDESGRNRVVNNRVDIGAVEFQPSGVSLTYMLQPTPGNPSEVTLFATVKPTTPGSNDPTGDVRFYLNDYTNVLGIQPLSGGQAVLTVPNLLAGKIGIQYEGDALFGATQVEFNYSGGPVGPGGSGTTTGKQPVLVGAGSGNQAAVGQSDGTSASFPAFTDGSAGGVRVAAADFNRDGVLDYVVGTGPGGPTHVRVIDGKTKTVLFTIDPFEASFTGGVFVAAGDLNGDGFPDLVITPDQGGGPRARVFSGKDFTQLADFFGIDDPNFRGGARAAVADVTGDGKGDLLVAAGFGGGPRLAVFDGTSIGPGLTPTKPFGDFFVFEQTLRNGVYVGGGDINGDGYADVVVGGGPGGAPRVFALSGKDLMAGKQVQVANFFAGDTNDRGGVRVAVRDVDGDGRADVIAGVGGGVAVYSGKAIPADGPSQELFEVPNPFPGVAGGVYVG
jgi:hypothetical protein